MEAIAHWVGTHGVELLVGLVGLAAIGGFVHWRGRPAWSDKLPVPILHGRMAAWLVALGIAGFGALALAIRSQYRVVQLDHTVTSAVSEFVGAAGLRMMAVISELGDTEFVTVFAVLILVILLVTRHWLLATGWGVTVLGSSFLIGLSKQEFQRARPVHEHGFALETTWSFPSGHAAGSLVFYGMLAYVLLVRLPSAWHRPVLFAAAGMVLMIGASRVILQVHYLSDVFAGYSLALAWLAMCIGATEFLRTASQRKPAG